VATLAKAAPDQSILIITITNIIMIIVTIITST